MADLRQHMNRVFHLVGTLMENFLKGIGALTQMRRVTKNQIFSSELTYESLNGALP